jgi:hypothetical protein
MKGSLSVTPVDIVEIAQSPREDQAEVLLFGILDTVSLISARLVNTPALQVGALSQRDLRCDLGRGEVQMRVPRSCRYAE